MKFSKLGGYEIIRLIGQGGMGAVYEGLNPTIGRRVAIKVLLPEYAHRTDVVRRFFNEAKAVNAISHPGVVQVSDVGTAEDGSLFLVMEFLEGQTLSERLTSQGGRLPEEEVVTICWQLAGVLAAAHAKNIVHRDLKPGNVMLVPDLAGPGGERVKLLDFGIAKLGAEHLHADDVKTRTGQTLGTAAYMSPEQFMGDQIIDGQTDVYSLGVVMFRLLTGRLPFISTSGEMALGMMHLSKPPPSILNLVPEVSPWLAQLVERMLGKVSLERPTMTQVMSELQERLPFRATSRSQPAVAPVDRSGVQPISVLGATDMATQTAQADSGGRSSQGGMLRFGKDLPSWLGLAPPPAPNNNPASGSITQATGQQSVASGEKGRKLRFLAVGLAALLIGIGGTFWYGAAGRRNQGSPATGTASEPSRSNPSPAAAVSSPTASDAARTPAGATSHAQEPAPPGVGPVDASASGGPSEREATGGASRLSREKAGKQAGSDRPATDSKSGRRASSGKASERRKEDHPRHAGKASATPIID